MKEEYPIHEVVDEVKAKLSACPAVILQAPPGAGKSTVLPLELLNEQFLSGKKMIMLEPRRLAARSVAMRMASMLGEKAGETIGYRVRFETRISARTKIEIVTEGILTRILQNDNALQDYALIIFDEFHERSLHADLSLALCMQCQEILRPDLKLLVMSATLDEKTLSSVLNNAPVVISKGRQFPVEIIYAKENFPDPLPVQVARLIKKAIHEQQGDLLVFLPGTGEILKTQQLLEENAVEGKVVPLYGELNFEKQQEAILPDKNGRRKIILSTSIAETSLTIEGITTVIDCGYARGSRFDPRSGLTRLETFRVSKDSADQRAGRAGRLGPGVCYRMWTEGTQLTLASQRRPEIVEADLASFMLELFNWGIHNVTELKWVSPPPAAHVAQAKDLLVSLQAIKSDKITATGKRLLEFPTHPRIAHMFLTAIERDAQHTNENRLLSADIAALLEERDPLERESGADIYYRLQALRNFRSKQWSGADRRLLERIEQLSRVWRTTLGVNNSDHYNDANAGNLIAAAYPERIARQLERNKPVYKLSNGKIARLPEGDPLISEEWIAVALLDAGKNEGRIFLAAGLRKEDIEHLAEEQFRFEWDERTGKVIAQQERVIGHLALSVKTIEKIEQEKIIDIICSAIKREGLKSFGWNEACGNWQARVMSVKKWNPDTEWPDVSEERLVESAEVWLAPFLNNVSSRDEIRRLNWDEIVHSILPWDRQQLLDELAPEKIIVPSGSSVKLQYFPDGKAPELHVRLQEVFGMTKSPSVNTGKINVVLHLLSPGFKPVQVTSDLISFWSGAYHEVRKELQRRYPKHSWPEDPFKAEAIRGPKKRNT